MASQGTTGAAHPRCHHQRLRKGRAASSRPWPCQNRATWRKTISGLGHIMTDPVPGFAKDFLGKDEVLTGTASAPVLKLKTTEVHLCLKVFFCLDLGGRLCSGPHEETPSAAANRLKASHLTAQKPLLGVACTGVISACCWKNRHCLLSWMLGSSSHWYC